ncbi:MULTISPECIES: transposase domain-containing protein [unclassified Streptomyces]|uniref:transposase domain-containing protein n=1 Tax=unclassified Streptomyces TaxID=2593676 RepID=UPI003D91C895
MGELTQIVDFALVDAVLEETRTREQLLLPPRVVAYVVLALAPFEHCSYPAVWGKLTAALDGLAPIRPAASSPARARRQVGTAPLHRLFEILAGPVADRGRAESFYRGLRTVPLDGTHPTRNRSPGTTRNAPETPLQFGYPAAFARRGRVRHPGRPRGRVRARDLR